MPDSPIDQLEVIGLEPTWVQSLSAEAEPLAILATGARGLVLLGFTASQDFRPSEELATPDFDPAEWKFLGYDVADFYLTSALYNAFGDMEDPKNYLEAFADQLNENGLFAMESDAELFACHKDAVRPDYAPWLPVGVWMALDIGAIAKGDAIRKNS